MFPNILPIKSLKPGLECQRKILKYLSKLTKYKLNIVYSNLKLQEIFKYIMTKKGYENYKKSTVEPRLSKMKREAILDNFLRAL